MKKLFALILTFVTICSFFVIAEEEKAFDTQKAYEWLLAQKQTDNSYGSVIDTSWTILALTEAGMYTQAEESEDYYDEKMGNGCLPKDSCKVKDTSLATFALEDLGKTDNFTDIDDWYNSILRSYQGTGRYLMELSPEPTGTCKLTFTANNVEQVVDIEVNEGKFPTCGNSYFLDIDSCVMPNLLASNPGLSINVDCSSMETAPIATALYKSSNTIYIIDSQENSIVDLSFSNGCFGRGAGDVCNKEASLYAAWALGKLVSEIDISFYLRDSYDRNSALDNALLYQSSPSSSHLEAIKRLQSTDGSWNKDVMATALAVIALNFEPTTYSEDIEDAKVWLAKSQKSDGSMNNDVAETAAVLYAAYAAEAELPPIEPSEEVCDEDGICDEDESISCSDCAGEGECGDGWCDDYAGETVDSCPEDCGESECGDGYCDIDYEDVQSCEDDCSCGDGVCDYVEESASEDDYDYCPEDCTYAACNNDGICDADEDDSCADCVTPVSPGDTPAPKKKSSWGTFIIVLVILIILGAGGYYAYKKGLFQGKGKKEPKSPFSGGSYKPFTSKIKPKGPGPMVKKPGVSGRPTVGPAARGKTFESALDKSLKEAKKLLKK